MPEKVTNWYEVKNASEIASPALLVYPDRIEENIKRMIEMAGGDPDRLRPHVKTHKMAQIIKLQMKAGILKFKCSTIAEVELVASCGANDILLAMQPVGPAIRRLFELGRLYPYCKFSAIVDSEPVIMNISHEARLFSTSLNLWLDINIGMNRTGVKSIAESIRLIELITKLDRVDFAGLHIYDGHNHEPEPIKRRQIFTDCIANINKLTDSIVTKGFAFPLIIAGGTPTFPFFAQEKNMELSPGTLILWDYGYSSSFHDLDFLNAAIVLFRVISKPGKNLLCFDLGTKAIASEMPHPRVMIPTLENYKIKSHFEEHLVIEHKDAGKFIPGDIFYGIPTHICPTVARYESVSVIRNQFCTEEWKVEARNRRLTI